MAEHLLYMNPTQSHPALAGIYLVAKQIDRLTAEQMSIHWSSLWRSRHLCRNGIMAQLPMLLRLVDADWCTPTSLAANGFTHHWPPDAAPVSGTSLACRWHNLRDLLRSAAWSAEATRRDKDFLGAELGIDFREILSAMMGHPCGPSLLCGGQWTACAAHNAGLIDSPICPRCNAAAETLEHRLWLCPAGSASRAQLQHLLPGVVFADLPNCLRRCGLIPMFGITLECPYNLLPITYYLIHQVRLATDSLHGTSGDTLSTWISPCH